MAAGKEQRPAIGILMILISILGVVGNTVTLILIIKNRTFRNVNHARLFLANLAVADLLNSILAMFSGFGHIDRKIIVDDHKRLCYSTGYAVMVLPFLTVFSMTLLTMNRYYTTVNNQKAKKLFKQRLSFIYIISIWIFSGLFFSIFGLISPKVRPIFKVGQGFCVLGNRNATTSMAIMGTLGSACLLCMCCVNFRIWLHLRRYNRRIRNNSIVNSLESFSRDKKITKIVSVIFLSYITLYAPIIIKGIVVRMSGKEKVSIWSTIPYVLLNMNYVNNFFIYGIMDEVYRRNLRRLFCKGNMTQVLSVRTMRNFQPSRRDSNRLTRKIVPQA